MRNSNHVRLGYARRSTMSPSMRPVRRAHRAPSLSVSCSSAWGAVASARSSDEKPPRRPNVSGLSRGRKASSGTVLKTPLTDLADPPLRMPRGLSARYLRIHKAVTATPGVHFAPSLAPLAHTNDTSSSLSAQITVSVPVTARKGVGAPGSPLGPGGPTGPGGPAGP